MQVLVSSVFCVLFAVFATAAPSQTLFDPLNEKELRETLKEEASATHHSIGYDRARIEIFGNLYLDKTAFVVHDVYCERDYNIRKFQNKKGGPTPDVVPSATQVNTEHTWPQSRFGGASRDKQKADLHHLFPSDSQMNSIRGNFPFGEVAKPINVKCPISAAGDNNKGDFVFEPPVGHRGNVARALFYFSVRYDLHIDPTQEAVLRKWNDQDPVTDTDRARNDLIEGLQGNRNPFIDHPEFVSRITDF